MGRNMVIEVSDETYEVIAKAASATGEIPEAWAGRLIEEGVPFRDERLRQHFGAVNAPYAVGANNEEIDALLVREYGHE